MSEKPQETDVGGAQIHVEQTAGEVHGKVVGVEIGEFYSQMIVQADSIEDLEDLPPAPGEPPYKGLAYFTEADADIFFGRKRLTDRLVGRLQETRFLAVVGASGSGKSSLLRAGVVPELREQNWAIHILTPAADPLKSLANSLTRDDALLAAADTEGLKRRLAAEPGALAEVAGKLAARANQSRLLLLVDQFEETFTLCKEEEERRAFLGCLEAAAAAESAATVLIGVRADFYDRCLQYDGLRRVLAEQQEPLGPMTEEELVRVIAEPAKRGGWQFVEGLVEQMMEDVGQEPGRLPLLSHALRETWERRRGTVMTLAGYRAAGGVEEAIAETAESVWENVPDEQETLVEHVFLSLTELGEGAEDTRRIVDAEELTRLGDEEEVTAVLERLVRARLVTVDEGQVEVAHEVLIRRWPRLREWLEENRERLRFERQLARDAQAWDELERDPGALYRGARLARAVEWQEEQAGERLDPLTKTFLEASRDLAEAEAQEEEARRQRELEQERALAEEQRKRAEEAEARRASEQQRAEEQERAARRLRRLVAGLLIVTLFALLAVGLTIFSRLQAERQARIAEARALAAQSAEIANNDFKESLLLAIAAVKKTMDEDEPVVSEAYYALYRTLALDRNFSIVLGPLYDPDDFVGFAPSAYAFSPDGKRLISPSAEGLARLWDASGNLVGVIGERSMGPILAVAFSPDGGRVITASSDGFVRIWDGSFNIVGSFGGYPFSTHIRGLTSVAFSPLGERVLTGSRDNTARLWDASGNLLHVLEGHTDEVTSARFSPDGERVLTSGRDNAARLWDASGNLQAVLEGHTDGVRSAIFSPGGERVLTVDRDNTARLWDASGDLLRALEEHTGIITSVAFSPEGERVLTGGRDNTARLWDGSGNLLHVLEGHADIINSVAFSPNGERVLTGSRDNTARLWDASGNLLHVLEGHTDIINSVAFSPNGERVLTGGRDNTARLWDASGNLLHVLEGHTDSVSSAHFSPDGRRVLTFSSDGTVRFWGALGNPMGNLLHVLQGHTTREYETSMNLSLFPPEAPYRSPFSDGEHLVTLDDNTVRLWDTPGRLRCVLQGHMDEVTSARLSPDGERVVSGSRDDTARLWDTSCNLLSILEGHVADVIAVTFSPDGERVLTASRDDTVRLWDASGNLLAILEGHIDSITALAFSPEGQRVATGSADSTARLWDASGNLLALLQGHADGITSVAFSPDGERLVTTSEDGTARLWNRSGDLLNVLEEKVMVLGQTQPSASASFSPEGRLILTASYGGKAWLWSASGRLRHTLRGYGSNITSATFSADGERVLASGRAHEAVIWDTSGNLLHILEGHGGAVVSATFSPDGDWVATGSWDQTTRLWDASGNLLVVLDGHADTIRSVAFSPDGKWVLTDSSDGTVRLWLVDPDSLLTEARLQLWPLLALDECKQYFPDDCPIDATELPLP